MVDYRLYVILDPKFTHGTSIASVAREAIGGGATILQVRAKLATARELLAMTLEVMSVARPAGVPVIVNDRVDVAVAAGADGVHLGEDDLPVALARRIAGPGAIIGFSAGTPALARAGEFGGADYFGTGDVFGTHSKADADPPIGLSGLREVVLATSRPVVAIGGIAVGNAAGAVACGAAGVATISAVAAASDVRGAARALRDIIDAAAAGQDRADHC